MMHFDQGMECFFNQHAFITLKDYNENFKSNLKCRLTNPSKTEVWHISISMLKQHHFNIGRENWVEPVEKYTSNQLV